MCAHVFHRHGGLGRGPTQPRLAPHGLLPVLPPPLPSQQPLGLGSGVSTSPGQGGLLTCFSPPARRGTPHGAPGGGGQEAPGGGRNRQAAGPAEAWGRASAQPRARVGKAPEHSARSCPGGSSPCSPAAPACGPRPHTHVRRRQSRDGRPLGRSGKGGEPAGILGPPLSTSDSAVLRGDLAVGPVLGAGRDPGMMGTPGTAWAWEAERQRAGRHL